MDPSPGGRLESINISPGGVPKRPAPEAMVTANGIEGDDHDDRHFHGGPSRAVSLFSAERIAALQGEGHPIAPGTTGENLTVSGVDWTRVVPGVRLDIGEVRLEVTRYTTPCATIRGSFTDGATTRIAQEAHPGWSRVYARVLAPGRVRVGDRVVVLD